MSTRTGLTDAAVVGRRFIRGRPLVLAITDKLRSPCGSMGSVVGKN